jgi:hypothetical protein
MSVSDTNAEQTIDIMLQKYCDNKRRKRTIKETESPTPTRFCSQLYPRGIGTNSYPDLPVVTRSEDAVSCSPCKMSKNETSSAPVTTKMANMLCVICYCRLKEIGNPSDATEIETTPCNHSFHAKCLKKWKKMSTICPICRQ